MILCPARHPIGTAHFSGIPIVERAKILGIWFLSNNTEASQYEWNFRPQLLKMNSVCNSWAHRNTSIKGKVTIVNSMLISLLQYPCSSIFTPVQVYKEYRRLVTNFIWNGRKPKVAYNTLTLPVDQGGLNLMDLEVRVGVSVLQWIRRLSRAQPIMTTDSVAFICNTRNLRRLLSYKSVPHHPDWNVIPFYKQMFKVWHTYHAFEPENEAEVRREILWRNHRIVSEGATLHWKRWEQAGILSVGDICHENEDRILCHTELEARFGIKCSFLEMLRLRLSVPHSWRNMITANWVDPPNPALRSGIEIALPDAEKMDIVNTPSKAMYKAIIQGKNHTSTAYLQPTAPQPRCKHGDP